MKQDSGHASSALNREHSHDLRWLADNLSVGHFQALSSGLGLGGLKTPTQRTTASVFPHLHEQQRVLLGAAAAPAAEASSVPAQRDVKPRASIFRTARGTSKHAEVVSQPPPKRKLSWRQWLVIWSADFAFVVASLGLAFATAVVLSIIKTGETENWLELRPVAFLAARSAVEILAAVYASFAAYMLVFKLGAGKTFGEVIFASGQAKNASSVTH